MEPQNIVLPVPETETTTSSAEKSQEVDEYDSDSSDYDDLSDSDNETDYPPASVQRTLTRSGRSVTLRYSYSNPHLTLFTLCTQGNVIERATTSVATVHSRETLVTLATYTHANTDGVHSKDLTNTIERTGYIR